MILIPFANVIGRYAVEHSLTWATSAAQWLFLLTIFAAMPVAIRTGRHMSLTALTECLPPRPRAFCAATADALVTGKTMRVLQNPLHTDLWRSLNANPTPVPITAAYNALKTRVVDYMDMTMSGYEALKLYEVVPYFSRTAHIYALGAMYLNLGYWNALS